MTIKLIANLTHKGKAKQLCEEIKGMIPDPPERKDTSKISKMVKKLFEDELCRMVTVKTRIKKESIQVVVNIKPAIDEEC